MPSPTSLSYPQPAPKPSFTGWQQSSAQLPQTSNAKQSRPSGQTHSYPASQTGLSGGNAPRQPPVYQETVQKSHSYPQTSGASGIPSQQSRNQQSNHGYPSSNGLSGSGTPGQKVSGVPNQEARNQQPSQAYPSSNGLSGAGAGANSGYPIQQGSGQSSVPQQYPQHKSSDVNYQGSRGMYPQTNVGNNNYYNHNQGPPPPYPGNFGPGNGGYSGYGYGHNTGYGSGFGQQMPGYFGNYANNGKGFGGVSRSSSALTGLGIAGAGVGTILTGLALWNLARATGNHRHTVIYDNRGQPVAVQPNNETSSAIDSWLTDLVNCSLTISNTNKTEVLAIPCAIATSFSPEADVKDTKMNGNSEDTTKCTVSVLTKSGKEYMTTIPCSVLLSTAAENNVTEAALPADDISNINNVTNITPVQNIINGSVEIPDNMTNVQNIPETLPAQNNAYGPIPPIHLTNYTGEILDLDCRKELGDSKDQTNLCSTVTKNLTDVPPVNFN
ncbi:hypothetical protein EVAR_90096_1 [Eumeta japonica]|uniref:Uncharacterized protein n=1 Tax=Eumeta variegata TaxID=151549 RepID=A0A4C1X2A7_EUMVA|nr:hypothetical protein EVAR_90096_1 [Eumeta japonica]